MWVYSIYGNVNFPTKFSGNKGYGFSISLGLNKGFANVVYHYNGGPLIKLVKGSSIFIPKGDIKMEDYLSKDKETKQRMVITTNYIELILTKEERANAKFEVEEKTYETSRENSALDNISKTKEEEEDVPWELDL